jgi:hypothetical protein
MTDRVFEHGFCQPNVLAKIGWTSSIDGSMGEPVATYLMAS